MPRSTRRGRYAIPGIRPQMRETEYLLVVQAHFKKTAKGKKYLKRHQKVAASDFSNVRFGKEDTYE